MRFGKRLHCDPVWQRSHATNLDAVVEDGDGHIAAGDRIVTVHDCIEQDLTQRSRWDRETVLPNRSSLDAVLDGFRDRFPML